MSDRYDNGLDIGSEIVDKGELEDFVEGLFDGLTSQLRAALAKKVAIRLWAHSDESAVGMVEFRSSISTMLDCLRTGKADALMLTRSPGDARWVILPA